MKNSLSEYLTRFQLFSLLLLCSQLSWAQVVTITPSKPIYELGEPVYVTLTVSNSSAESASIPPRLDPEFGDTIIMITKPTGESAAFVPVILVEHDGPAPSLGPGESSSENAAIFFGRDGWTFNRPGNYRLTAALRGGAGAQGFRAQSEPIEIEVKPGTAGSEELVSGDANSEQAGKFLLWLSGDHLEGGIDLLSRIARTEPDSVMASYIELAFGWSKSRSFSNFITGEVRGPDDHAALSHLANAHDRHLPPRLRLQKMIAQAACHIRLGETDNAEGILEASSKSLQEHPEFQEMSEQLERLKKALSYSP